AVDSRRGGFHPLLHAPASLKLPLSLEVKQSPPPTNHLAFTIGQDLLRVGLGAPSQLVPEDQFGISGSSRPIDPGFGYKGFRVGVMGWLHDDAELQLGDKLLAFLRDSVPARHNTLYSADVHGLVASGFAPTVGY